MRSAVESRLISILSAALAIAGLLTGPAEALAQAGSVLSLLSSEGRSLTLGQDARPGPSLRRILARPTIPLWRRGPLRRVPANASSSTCSQLTSTPISTWSALDSTTP